MKFNDLKFKQLENGVGATHTFDNGTTISVQASKDHYCYPKENLNSKNDYSSFEVAIWDIDNEYVTKDYVEDATDDVLGWQGRDDIDNLMIKIQEDI
jgi:hypothetical protein